MSVVHFNIKNKTVHSVFVFPCADCLSRHCTVKSSDHSNTGTGVSHDWPLLSKLYTLVGIFDFKLFSDAMLIKSGEP